MGGRALKNTITTRKTTEQFIKIGKKLVPILKDKLNTDVFITKYYHSKETHGDMDILIKIDQNFHNKGLDLRKIIIDTFNPNETHSNGSVISFDFEEFQIDLIPIKESIWDIAKIWFSYDPISNLTGKVAHKFGLKNGWNGLVYPFRNFNGKLSKDITLSKDPKEIFEFLGYDYNRYLKGFDTMEEIFEFIISSKFFDHRNFLMENLNHIDRKRNKKRKSYQEFLKYISDNNIDKSYDFKKDKSEYIDFIDENFPNIKIKEKIKDFEKTDKENQLLNERFNGRLIMSCFPDLKGKNLGDSITNFRNQFDDFRTYGLNHSSDEIMEDFMNFHND